MFDQDCTLLVMSCDKYESAWNPYFVLLHRYWKEHPKEIVLCTEKKQYEHPGLQIKCSNCFEGATWSQRLLTCLKDIQTKYVIFSLEDFFLQSEVNHLSILECYEFMEMHPNVAVCRLKDSTNPMQVLGEEVFSKFYIAGPDVDFRLETQIALWNRETLMSFINENEDPWQFETYGTKRIADTDYQFLWYKSGYKEGTMENIIVPYTIGPDSGYGITWGKWLWKNKKFFQKHGINVNFEELGTLTPLKIRLRERVIKAVYKKEKGLYNRVFSFTYRVFNKIKRMI